MNTAVHNLKGKLLLIRYPYQRMNQSIEFVNQIKNVYTKISVSDNNERNVQSG